jgi:hypothetical protein
MCNITLDKVLQRMSKIKEDIIIIGNDYDSLTICQKCPVLGSNLNEQELWILIDTLKDNVPELGLKMNPKRIHPLLWCVSIKHLFGINIKFTDYKNEFRNKLIQRKEYFLFEQFLKKEQLIREREAWQKEFDSYS